MSTKFLEPSSAGLRRPTDNSKTNGTALNPPRFAEHGGLTSPSKISQENPLKISKPGGGRV